MRSTVLLLFCLFFGITAYSQKAVYDEVSQIKGGGRAFQKTSLFTFETDDVLNRSFNLEGLKQGTVMAIDHEAIQSLVQGQNDFIELSLPVSSRSDVKLTLVRQNIFAEDFALYTSANPKTPIPYDLGLHYKGIIDGDINSSVAVSIFNNEIMGMVNSSEGTFVLGRIQTDRENRHVLYNTKDLDHPAGFDCGTADDGLPYTEADLKPSTGGRDAGDCVRIYIEIDDDIVTQKGGATPATNYITGLFNQSFVLYQNESVTLTISEILAWTTNSPYSGSTSSAMLNSFVANSGAFNGNIGHLVSYQASGGIAYLNTLCNSNPDYRKCFSSIASSYQNVPTYSWSVMVVTHEMGHVIGSKHTHACAWNGNNTAIDGCAGAVEGNCALPGNPVGGGTIMSYCHLNVGINFSLGFGPQPGNVIRNNVNASNNCLTSCGPPPPPPPPAYCSSNGNNSSYEWINKVVLASINNTSGNNQGYGNFTNLSTNLTKGTTYTITLTPGFSGSAYNEYWKVWIDYNGDLDWSDAGEAVAQGSGSGTINVSFTVPAGSPLVTTRMRVSMQYNGYPPNCGSFTYGEVEDYKVVIVGSSGNCNDGIQNNGETGVDCGGPCIACPTCNDGIQNQGETGVDCGGPCAPCPPAGNCFDGIQNNGETGVDCGGPCPKCPTGNCFDGIQNNGETGVDCGGPCEPCPPSGNCNDGIQNNGETGVDCGGSCSPCPTCFDGIQNQGETGIDCGGPCVACPPPPPPGDGSIIHGAYFETGWDGWSDGGVDVARVITSNSYEGLFSIRIADNSGAASAMTSPTLNLLGATGAKIKFHFYAFSMENGEDFFLQYKVGTSWVTIGAYIRGINFNNNTFYSTTVLVPNFVPIANAQFRIQCDAGDNNDQVFIDAITVEKLTGGALVENGFIIEELPAPSLDVPVSSVLDNPDELKELSVYPNPVQDFLNLDFDGEISHVRVLNLNGQEVKITAANYSNKLIDISYLSPGIYFIWVESGGLWYPSKFSKL